MPPRSSSRQSTLNVLYTQHSWNIAIPHTHTHTYTYTYTDTHTRYSHAQTTTNFNHDSCVLACPLAHLKLVLFVWLQSLPPLYGVRGMPRLTQSFPGCWQSANNWLKFHSNFPRIIRLGCWPVVARGVLSFCQLLYNYNSMLPVCLLGRSIVRLPTLSTNWLTPIPRMLQTFNTGIFLIPFWD